MAKIARRSLFAGTAALPIAAAVPASDLVVALWEDLQREREAEAKAFALADAAYATIPEDVLEFTVSTEFRTAFDDGRPDEVRARTFRSERQIEEYFGNRITPWEGSVAWAPVIDRWKARRAAVLAEYHQKLERREQAMERSGYTGHCEKGYEHSERVSNIERRICETVATSPAGIVAQVRLAEMYADPDQQPGDDRMVVLYASIRQALA